MAFAELAVISKSEISGHRSAQTQVELNVSKKLEAFPIVAAIRALLTSIRSKRFAITAKVKKQKNIRRGFARISVRNSIHKLQLRFHGWNDLEMRCQPGHHGRARKVGRLAAAGHFDTPAFGERR
ncbi:unnamed protein product [Stenotrophomonas maltophilia]|nr:unnamed protein product [Stenotrophomonas maltophilia]